MEILLQQLKSGEQQRESLSKMAKCLASCTSENIPVFSDAYADALLPLLGHEDAKTRKNCAKVLSYFADERIATALMEAYRKETVWFVRPFYLGAMLGYPVENYHEELVARREWLLAEDIPAESKKHANEELKAIEEYIGQQTVSRQQFVGEQVLSDVMLVANPLYTELLYQQLGEVTKKKVGGGVLVRTADLSTVLENRLYREVLFVIPTMQTVPDDPYAIAKQLAGDLVWNYLKVRHKGGDVFCYRMEVRGLADERKKALFLKRVNGEILRLSGGRLRNESGNYDIEFRLILREGGYRLLIKMMRLADKRFVYRRESVAASIQPTDAAYCMAAFAEHFHEDAQVLDPFCGVGTMLIERHAAKEYKIAFGIDTFGEAIDKAKRNTASAGTPVHYIHRDFFDFKHESLFDEIVTNLPFVSDFSDEPVMDVYRRFFVKAEAHLKADGSVLLISHNPTMVRRYAGQLFTIVESRLLREKLPLEAFLLKKKVVR